MAEDDEQRARADFARRLQAAVVDAGLSQRRLAAEVGASKQTVTNWVNGTHEPSLRHLRRLAQVLDTSIAELVDGGDASSDAAVSPERRLIEEFAALELQPSLRALEQATPALLEVLSAAQGLVRARKRSGATPRGRGRPGD